MKFFLSFILILTSIISLNAQVIFEENFNGSNGTTSGSANGVNWSSSCPACVSGDYWEINNGVFEGNDTNGEADWQTDSPIDISNCGSIEISFDIESVGSMEDCNTGCNSVDFVRFQYNIDGAGWTDPANSYFCGGPCAGSNVVASGDTPLTNYSTGCITTTGSNLQIRILVQTWAGSEYWRIDNVTVNCGSTNAGTNGNIDICSSSTTAINLFDELGGTPENNGSWSGSSTLTGGNLGTFDPATMNAGVYTYTVGSGTCQESSTVTVNLIPAGNAGIDNTIALCDNGNSINLFDGLIGTPDNNGTWSGPSALTSGSLGTFDPTMMNAGVYTYTTGTGTCQSTATVTVNINPTGNSGNNGTISLCDNAATINLFDQLGGTPDNFGIWSGPSTLTGGNLGTFDPTTLNTGVYTYSVTNGVCQSNSTVSVTINSSGNSGIANTIDLCDNSGVVNLFNELGGTPDATGSWAGPSILTGGNLGIFDLNTMNAGVYTYTVGTATCFSSSSVTVNVNPQGNAGVNSTLQVCDNNQPLNLYNKLGGNPDNNGTWSGPSLLTGGDLGTFDPGTMTSGLYTYTVGNGNCQNSASVAVNINLSGNSGNNTVLEICNNESAINLYNELGGNPTNNGIWSGPSTLTGGNLGVFDPATMNPGTYEYNSVTAAGCAYSQQIQITVNSIQEPSFTSDFIDSCGPRMVNFTNTSTQISNNCLWDFGNGNTSTNCSDVADFYDIEGQYDVSLTITDDKGCIGIHTKLDYIKISPFPVAQFSSDQKELAKGETQVNFYNESSNSTSYTWNFGDGSALDNSFDAIHTYTVAEEESITIILTASNNSGCVDTASLKLDIKDDIVYYVPNSFTPNNDGYNSNFKPIFTSGFDPQNYTLLIYNRWGELLFESHNNEIGWDGTYGNNLVEEGTYVWVIQYNNSSNTSNEVIKGIVNLLR